MPYLPCAVEEILAMARDCGIRPQDRFVDLGSGLGRAVMLVHLLTGASALGIEIQEPLVQLAQNRAFALDLSGVSFVCADAAETALEGSFVFLYAPCNGAMLRAVQGQLEKVARKQAIVIGAVDLPFDEVPWLLRREPRPTLSLAIYDSIPASESPKLCL